MGWFFGKKEAVAKKEDKTLQQTNLQIQKSDIKKEIQTFKIADKISIEQIEGNVFKSCVSKCLKQNNSNLQKSDGIHVAVYHCMQFCGQKWQHAIQIDKEMVW